MEQEDATETEETEMQVEPKAEDDDDYKPEIHDPVADTSTSPKSAEGERSGKQGVKEDAEERRDEAPLYTPPSSTQDSAKKTRARLNWTRSEDARIMQLVNDNRTRMSWSSIDIESTFPGRSPMNVKNRFAYFRSEAFPKLKPRPSVSGTSGGASPSGSFQPSPLSGAGSEQEDFDMLNDDEEEDTSAPRAVSSAIPPRAWLSDEVDSLVSLVGIVFEDC
ncbi:hypothetical protein MNV49_002030 [Pseudohyphozyma bogoriensis]|nr:hypothetical protein MNV49_002030 [Pseudohyphozyma bogoriensis]